MASIFYAWEFGANLGHVGAFMPLAKSLRAKGHHVHWAVTQAAQVGDYLASEGFSVLPGPTCPEQQRQGPPLSYADILLRFGYADPKGLFGLVGAWRELMRLTGAELVMTDHAPTAILAAKTLDLPVMLFSNGFTVPPRVTPLPNMRSWIDVPEFTLCQIDLMALFAVNTVLARHRRPQLQQLCELFDVAEEALITFPEVDHYPERGPARYWGSLPSAGAGRRFEWPKAPDDPDSDGTLKVFAYLRPECLHHEAMLAALAATGYTTAVYFPGVLPATVQRFTTPQLGFLTHPADIEQMTLEVDLAVTYASLATTTAFLLGGKPLLMLPTHLEQFLVARRVADMGAGVVVSPDQPPGDLAAVLREVMNNVSYRQNAQAFAAKYAAFDQSRVLENLVRRIEELLTPAAEENN